MPIRFRCGLSGLTLGPVDAAITISFLPGFACDATDFVPLMMRLHNTSSHLQSSIRYISLAFPGHGNTAASICPDPSLEVFADLVNEVREELHEFQSISRTSIDSRREGMNTKTASNPEVLATRMVLAGHSMGTRVALSACARSPPGIDGLILLDGSYFALTPSPAIMSRLSGSPPRNIPSAAPLPTDVIRRAVASLFGPNTPTEFKQRALEHAEGCDVEYLRRLRQAHANWDHGEMEGAVEKIVRMEGVKILILQSTEGRGGRRVRLEKGEEGCYPAFWKDKWEGMDDERCQLRCVTVDGSGHWPHVDRTEEVARLVAEEFRSIGPVI